MGYTLSWTYDKEKTDTKFSKKFLKEAEEILDKAKKAKIPFGNWEGKAETTKVLEDHGIRLNGIYPKSCETFYLRPSSGVFCYSSCNTCGNSYGAIGIALLKLAKKHKIITEWSSNKGDDDIKTRELYESIYNKKEETDENQGNI